MCIAVTRGRTRVMRCSGVCFWLNLQDGQPGGRAARQDGRQAGRRQGAAVEAAAAAAAAACIPPSLRTTAPHTRYTSNTNHTPCVGGPRSPAHNVRQASVHACAAEVKSHGVWAVLTLVAPPSNGVQACGWQAGGQGGQIREGGNRQGGGAKKVAGGNTPGRNSPPGICCGAYTVERLPQPSQPTPWCT